MTAKILKGDAKGRYQLASLLPKRTPGVAATVAPDGTVTLTPLARLAPAAPGKPRLVKRGGVKLIAGVKVTREEIVAAIQEDRAERENLL